MNKAEIEKAVQMALSDQDLRDYDDTPMHGCGLPDFGHCTVTIGAAARFIRWQCVYLNGKIDGQALNDLAPVLRRRVTVLDA